MPPWTSFELLDDVPEAKSARSTSAVFSPREMASSAHPTPVMPPPMTSTSNSSSPSRRSASARSKGGGGGTTPGYRPVRSGPLALDRAVTGSASHDRAGRPVVGDHGVPGSGPRLEAADEVGGVVPRGHQGLGDPGRSGAGAADHHEEAPLGDLALAGRQLAHRDPLRAVDVPGAPLVGLPHVEDGGFGVGIEAGPGLVDGEGRDPIGHGPILASTDTPPPYRKIFTRSRSTRASADTTMEGGRVGAARQSKGDPRM